MSGVHGQVLSHVVRRGVYVAKEHFTGASAKTIQKLQHDAALYDAAGPEMEMNPQEFLPVVITGLLILVFIASVRYTLGTVVASLAMIETPSSTAIIESKPPAYAGEPDAPLEKEPLMPAEAAADRDVEIMLIQNKVHTASIRSSITLLHRTGGFFGRWRGLGFSIFYNMLHGLVANFLASLVGFGIFGHAITYIFTSLGLARLHMAWTHKMISAPSNLRWNKRIVPRKQCKAILLPTFVFAAAQQATIILPIAVAFALGLPEQFRSRADNVPEITKGCHSLPALKFLAVPATALIVAFAVLLPAAVTLTRIEAALLPSDQQTIVPFDRAAVIGDIDMTQRGACRAIFVQAWRSFDRAARLRLIKLYAKMIMAEIAIAFTGVCLIISEVALIGGARIELFVKSGAAQLQLMAIEAHQNGN